MRANRFLLFCSASVLLLSASACRDEPEPRPEPVCTEAPLPLQNPSAHTLGETFYLPRLKQDAQCPSTLEWEVVSAPEGSRNTAYTRGAPEPRFTPDMPGDYVLRLGKLRNS